MTELELAEIRETFLRTEDPDSTTVYIGKEMLRTLLDEIEMGRKRAEEAEVRICALEERIKLERKYSPFCP